MSYHVDLLDSSLVIDGWENGIAPDPYEGTANLQNVNIGTIPGEASVGFSTSPEISTPSYSAVTVSAYGDGSTLTFTNADAPLLEIGQAIYFSSSSISGIGTSSTSVYWVYFINHTNSPATFGITNAYGGSGYTFGGTTGTAMMYTYNPSFQTRANITKNYLTETSYRGRYHWALDSTGLVWSDINLTSGGIGITSTSSWTYTGNYGRAGNASPNTYQDAYGNGMVYMQTANSGGGLDGWIFIWRNGEIDYLVTETNGVAKTASQLSWVYGWNPNTGTTNQTGYLFTGTTNILSHEAYITPDGRLSYCDGYRIVRFYQTDTVGPTNFDPTNTGTYTFNTYPLLPPTDTAQCLQYLGSYLYIGGNNNILYPWDMVQTQYSIPPILLPESNTINLVTVGQIMYIFTGNRGNIYITNGSQATWWTKVPDHLSGIVQPTFTWGGATAILNKLYFGISATSNGTSTVLPGYAGIWGADLVTKGVFVSNVFKGSSSATATGLLAMNTSTDAGTTFTGYGVFATYSDGTNSGVEGPSNVPYTNSTAVIETEVIPIGTFNKPRDLNQIEYKLVTPMKSGDSITVYARQAFDGTYAQVFTDNTVGHFSNTFPNNFLNPQWLQFKAVLNTAGTTTSYVRLKELRILGLTGPTLAQAMELQV